MNYSDTVRTLTSRRQLSGIVAPRLGQIFRLETETAEGVEVYRDARGLHVVDDAGDVHSTADGPSWRDLVAQLLELPMIEEAR